MQITKGKNKRPQKVVLYGPEGIGKSTFASFFPAPVISDVEGSTDELDVARFPKPTSWEMLNQQYEYLKKYPHTCRTWVIDTADWAEMLCKDHICSKAKKEGIEDFGYGKGYVYLEEEFGRFLNKITDLLDLGINIVFTAHAQRSKFDEPDQMGSYDRWELKLEKKTAPLLKEWADMILFANYKTYVVNVDGQGAAKGKNKAQGGQRVLKTSHHPTWDAKNRHGLPEEIDFKYESIAHCIPNIGLAIQPQNTSTAPTVHTPVTTAPPVEEPKVEKEEPKVEQITIPEPVKEEPKEVKTDIQQSQVINDLSGIPKALADLMKLNNVSVADIQKAVSHKGYYPKDTPITNYDPEFVSGVLVAAWQQVYKMIQDLNEVPF